MRYQCSDHPQLTYPKGCGNRKDYMGGIESITIEPVPFKGNDIVENTVRATWNYSGCRPQTKDFKSVESALRWMRIDPVKFFKAHQ